MTSQGQSWVQAFLFSAFIGAAIAFAGHNIGAGLSTIGKQPRTVSVKGLAERTVKSDKGEARLSFLMEGNDRADLYKNFQTNQNAFVEQLKSRGFDAAEISIGSFQANQSAADEMKADPKRFRYSLSNQISIVSEKLDAIKDLAAQGNQMSVDSQGFLSGIRAIYRYNRLSNIRADMIAEATKDARKAALQFAADSNSQLGAIANASQGVFSISDPDSDSEYDTGDSIDKKVRVVTTVDYFLRD